MTETRHVTLSILALLAFAGGCTANKMYRPVSVQENSGYELAFIEFDDQGEMWDPAQLSRALEVIERANEGDGSVVITYVHGWQHNASPKSEEKPSGNVHGFKGYLNAIAQVKLQSAGKLGSRKLVGIYIGWRGKSGTVPGLNLATFYDRSGTARRISGTSSTEVIYRIMSTSKENPNSKVILMGHSFGGQILERSVTQALVGELLGGVVQLKDGLPADLVILINPAAKSIQAKQFVEMLDRNHIEIFRTGPEGTRYKVPLMVSITSSADLATRWAFPAGTWVSSIGKNFHKYSADSCLQFPRQRSFYTRTPGHNEALVSHEVTAEPLAPGEQPTSLSEMGTGLADLEFDPIAAQEVFSFKGEEYKYTVRSLSGAVNNTPYWIMQVPRQLIAGHSGFFTADTLRLIAAIIEVTGAVEEDVSTELVRDSGVRPNNIEVMSDGRVMVADASRRIYEVKLSSPTPILYGCIPDLADPSANIGLNIEGQAGFGATSRPTGKSTRKGTDEFVTHVASFNVGVEDVSAAMAAKPIKLDAQEQFAAAAFDFENQRAFMSGVAGKIIYQVDLTQKSPAPELWLDVEEEGVISDLHYDNKTGALFAAGSTDGVLYRLTEHGQGPRPTLIARSLGWPVGMAIDNVRNRVYVGDAKGKQIWRIDCPERDSCDQPRSLLQSDLFASPSELGVDQEGRVWIADRESRVIVALSPEGEILQKITDLPRE